MQAETCRTPTLNIGLREEKTPVMDSCCCSMTFRTDYQTLFVTGCLMYCEGVGLEAGMHIGCNLSAVSGSGGNINKFSDKHFIGRFPSCTILTIKM